MVNTLLGPFLQQCAARRFEPGQFDCGLWLADWVRLARDLDFDPAEGLRGKYTDLRAAARLLGRDGLRGTVNAIAARCQLMVTADPMRGDIGLVRPTEHGNRITGAIRGGKGWVLLTPAADTGTGISLAPDEATETVTAWRT